jgi:methyl-accepting chemotaxis protein
MVVDVTEDALLAPARKLALGLAIGGLVLLAAALSVLAVASRQLIARPLLALRGVVGDLAASRYDRPVAEAARADEIGAIGRALETLREELARAQAAREEQETLRRTADADRDRAAALTCPSTSRPTSSARSARPWPPSPRATWAAASPVRSPTSTSRCAADFNTAVASLEQAIGEIAEATSAIGETSETLSAASGELGRRTARQAAGIERAAGSLNAITQAMGHMAGGADETRRLVAAARGEADEGGAVVARAARDHGRDRRLVPPHRRHRRPDRRDRLPDQPAGAERRRRSRPRGRGRSRLRGGGAGSPGPGPALGRTRPRRSRG